MSQVKVQQPVTHIPSFKRWSVSRYYAEQALKPFGFEFLYPGGVHANYYYTDTGGVIRLLPHLLFKSNLYKPDIFTCINYAYKVWLECGDKYDLNTWIPVIGRIPNYKPRHAWILIMTGNEEGFIPEEFLFFEPNDGWDMGIKLEAAGQAFPIGGEGYKGEFIFL